MAYWLFKEEPEHYSYADLEREGRTLWAGVSNNLARKNLREVRPGDRIWFYHTGNEKAVIGIDPIMMLAGRLSPRARALVLEWATLHQAELMADWDLARQQAPLNRIEPLE